MYRMVRLSCRRYLSGVVQQKYRHQNHLLHDPKQEEVTIIMDKLLSRLHSSELAKGSKGLYLYGSVGCGKTMLMDLFYSECKIPKRRTHFHKFMLDIHQRIHVEQQELIRARGRNVHIDSNTPDAVANVANALAVEFQVLCFDEFQLTDIADAWILSRLMNVLWRRGVVLVATSNRPCEDLYKNGLNREYFTLFIRSLQERSLVIHMDSNIDYRLQMCTHYSTPSYFTPVSPESSVLLFSAYLDYARVIKNVSAKPVTLPVMMGRTLTVPLGLPGAVCWVDFATLCEGDKGAADYKALCQHFHTIFLDGIPQLSIVQHDKARRFITLIDEIYDAGVRLVWTAQCVPSELFLRVSHDVIESEIEFGALATDHTWESDVSSAKVAKPDAAERSAEMKALTCMPTHSCSRGVCE